MFIINFWICFTSAIFKLSVMLEEGQPLFKDLCLSFFAKYSKGCLFKRLRLFRTLEYESQLIYNTIRTVEVATAKFNSRNLEVCCKV